MSTTPSPPAAPEPRKSRWRVQFSLQSIFWAMMLVAVVLSWLAPTTETIDLDNGSLRVVAVRRNNPHFTPPNSAPASASAPGPRAFTVYPLAVAQIPCFANQLSLQNHGLWLLMDREGRVLIDGGYRDGFPAGVWRTFEPHRRVAVEHDFRALDRWLREHPVLVERLHADRQSSHRWRQYYAGGGGVGAVPPAQNGLPVEAYLAKIPDCPASVLRARFANGRLASQLEGRYEFFRMVDSLQLYSDYLPQFVLHGGAAWFDEQGRLRLEGVYRNSLPHGRWREYDDAGELLSEGEYAHGFRHGQWRRQAANGAWETQRYFRGRTADEFAALEEELRREWASADSNARFAALERAAQFGPPAAPMLVDFYLAGDRLEKFAIIERLRQMDLAAPATLAFLAQAARDGDVSLRRAAMLAQATLDAGAADAHVSRLIDELAAESDGRLRLALIEDVSWLGAIAVPQLERSLQDADLKRRRSAVVILGRMLQNFCHYQTGSSPGQPIYSWGTTLAVPRAFENRQELYRRILTALKRHVGDADKLIRAACETIVQADAQENLYPLPPQFGPRLLGGRSAGMGMGGGLMGGGFFAVPSGE